MLGVRKIKQTDLTSPRWSALLEQQEAHPFRGVKVISPWRGWGTCKHAYQGVKVVILWFGLEQGGLFTIQGIWFLQLELNGQAGGAKPLFMG